MLNKPPAGIDNHRARGAFVLVPPVCLLLFILWVEDLLDLQDVVDPVCGNAPAARVPVEMVVEAGLVGVFLVAERAYLSFPGHVCVFLVCDCPTVVFAELISRDSPHLLVWVVVLVGGRPMRPKLPEA